MFPTPHPDPRDLTAAIGRDLLFADGGPLAESDLVLKLSLSAGAESPTGRFFAGGAWPVTRASTPPDTRILHRSNRLLSVLDLQGAQFILVVPRIRDGGEDLMPLDGDAGVRIVLHDGRRISLPLGFVKIQRPGFVVFAGEIEL